MRRRGARGVHGVRPTHPPTQPFIYRAQQLIRTALISSIFSTTHPSTHLPTHLHRIRERVEDELTAVREEGFELMGPDYDVIEKEEEKEEKKRKATLKDVSRVGGWVGGWVGWWVDG